MRQRHLFSAATAVACLWGALAMAPAQDETPDVSVSEQPVEGASVPIILPPPEPTPAPEPAPVAPTFRVPFSVNDCLSLLSSTIASLPRNGMDAAGFDPEYSLRVLASISKYLKDRDDLHLSLAGYTWEQVARQALQEDAPRDLELHFTDSDALLHVSTLSFSVERADAFVHHLVVYDTQEKVAATFQLERPIMLRHSLPKREFFYLYQPTDIGKIEVRASRAVGSAQSEWAPRIILEVGRTEQPEHAKSAIWFVERGMDQMRTGNYESARADLMRAQSEIRLFQSTMTTRR